MQMRYQTVVLSREIKHPSRKRFEKHALSEKNAIHKHEWEQISYN